MFEQESRESEWWLSDGERPTGPHNEAFLLAGIQRGAISPHAYTCPVGGQEWKLLCDWPAFARACAVAAIPTDVPLVARRSAVRADGSRVRQKKWSGLALSSFIIAMVAFVVHFVLLIIAAIGASTGAKETDPLMVCTGLFLFVTLGANLVGGVLGLIALTQPIRNKWMAAIGLAVNMLEIVGMIALLVIGSQAP
jgi:hypothetical protein